MNDLSHEIGLMRREVRDARAIASNVDHKLTRLIEGTGAPRRDGPAHPVDVVRPGW